MSAGAISGFAIGSVALVAVLALAYFIARRRKWLTGQKQIQAFSEESSLDEKAPYRGTLAKASTDQGINGLPAKGKSPYLAGVDGSSPLGKEPGHGNGFMAEMPGSAGRRFELPGHVVERWYSFDGLLGHHCQTMEREACAERRQSLLDESDLAGRR